MGALKRSPENMIAPLTEFAGYAISISFLIALVALCVPASVKVDEGKVIFSVRPYFRNRTAQISELDYFHVKKGFFPIYLRFRDGTVFKWTSFPMSRHAETLVMLRTAVKMAGESD